MGWKKNEGFRWYGTRYYRMVMHTENWIAIRAKDRKKGTLLVRFWRSEYGVAIPVKAL